jgi:hypothetical protein
MSDTSMQQDAEIQYYVRWSLALQWILWNSLSDGKYTRELADSSG